MIHLLSCSLRRWGCCTRGSCPCDAGIPSSGSTAPRWRTSQSSWPVGQWVMWHSQQWYPETGSWTRGGGETLFHSLSSLGSSKMSPSFTSWSFRELFSIDRVSLFPSIPYLARITAQPNTDALVIDYPDRLKPFDAPNNPRWLSSYRLHVHHFNMIWIHLTLKITQRRQRSWQ